MHIKDLELKLLKHVAGWDYSESDYDPTGSKRTKALVDLTQGDPEWTCWVRAIPEKLDLSLEETAILIESLVNKGLIILRKDADKLNVSEYGVGVMLYIAGLERMDACMGVTVPQKIQSLRDELFSE